MKVTDLEDVVYYDGPLVMIGSGDSGYIVLMMNVTPASDAGPNPGKHIAVNILRRGYLELMKSAVDLRTALLNGACWRGWFISDSDPADGEMIFEPIEDFPDEWLPDAGFFISKREE